MSQGWYSSLFGGAPPTNTFTRGANLPRGNPTSNTTSHMGYSPYVGPIAQSGPYSILGYNPINNHAFGGSFLSCVTYPRGQHPFTSHVGL